MKNRIDLKESVLILIEDNVVNLKLISTLEDLGIDASLYNLNSPSVVLELLELEFFENRDYLYKKYFDLLEQGKSIDFITSKVELRLFVLNVYDELLNLNNM